jgi:long-chain acyl-CoA synthetase
VDSRIFVTSLACYDYGELERRRRMQTEDRVSSNAAAYDARPWLAQYPADVPGSLNYPDISIWQLLEQTLDGYGDHGAFVFQNNGMTFRQLRDQAAAMAGALQRAGVKKGDAVLVLLPNIPHFPVTYFGTLRLGARLAAVSPTSVEREIENLIEDSGARVVVTIDLLYDKVASVWERAGVETVVVGTVTDFMPAWKRLAAGWTGKTPKPKMPVEYGPRVQPMLSFMRGGKKEEVATVVKSSDVAVLQYTGGTTGLPKAAMLTHGGLIANATQMKGLFPRLKDGQETILAVLPFFHVYGVTLVMNAGLLLAANTVLIARPVTMDIFEAVRRHRPTIFPGVPTLYVAVTNDRRHKDYDLSSIDVCCCGGAPLPLEVKREFERITGGHLYEGYGLSEASPLTHSQPHKGESPAGSMGLPVPDTDARIVGDDDQPVPPGEEGELVVRGPQVMQGYWRREQETAEALKGGWLHTGDIARMDEDGWFYIVDRKKDLIITGGENIYPREVEEVLYEHPKVQEAAVVGVPHPFGGEIAKAFIVLKPGEEATKKDITQFAAERLSKAKVPRAVEFRSELPKSAGLKILRRVLAEEERERQASQPRRSRERSGPDPDA